jgi:hypothetical protein
MIRKMLFFTVLAILCATSAPAALAARQDAGLFSVELPKGWEYSDNDPVHLFSFVADGRSPVKITISELDEQSLEEYAESEAEGYPVKMLPGGKSNIYHVGYTAGVRAWGMQVDDATVLEIATDAGAPGIPAFLASLQANAGKDALALAFQAAKSKEVVDWLTFTAPHYLDAELGLTLFSGNGMAAKLPKGWTATPKDEAVVFAVPGDDASGSITARAFSLPDREYPTFVAFAKELLREMGGHGFMEGQSGVEFTLEDGRTVLCTAFHGNGLILVVRDTQAEEEEAVEAFSLLLRSITLTKWQEYESR